MNALKKAREAIDELVEAMRQTSQARMAAQARQRQRQPVPAPRATKVYACGRMWQVLDADTNRVLGFRSTVREARWLATQLERGLKLQQ